MSRIWTPREDQTKVMAFGEPRDRWALFAPTGAGKTVIASTWMDAAMNDAMVPRFLIVAPKLVAQDGWPTQFATWAHLNGLVADHRVLVGRDFGLEPGVLIVSDDDAWEAMWSDLDEVTKTYTRYTRMALTFSDKRATKKHLQSMHERIHIVSWDYWPWLVKAYGKNFPYQGVIFDESSFLRDWSSERNKAARHALGRTETVSHVLMLTASPNDNHEPAVYQQIELLSPGLLGSTNEEFQTRWCQPKVIDRRTGQVWSWQIVPALRPAFAELVGKWAVSVASSLGVPLVPVEHRRAPDEAVAAAHAAMLTDAVCTIGGRKVVAKNSGTVHAKLRQISSGFVYDADSPHEDGKVLRLSNSKIDELAEMVESEPGQILVAFQWTEELRRLKAQFGKHIGDIRETGAKGAFVDGSLKLLAVHPASAGHGVDGLQHVCNQVVWTSVPEDGELHGQLNGRVHRHGTNSDTVFAHYLIAQGTREERIYDEVLPGKRSVAEAFLHGIRI